MPEPLVWEPRSFDTRKVFNQRDTWNGYYGILDDDRLTNMMPLKTDSALGVAATYVVYWIGGFEENINADYGMLVAKSGGNYKVYFFTQHALGAEHSGITGVETFSAIDLNSNIGYAFYGANPASNIAVISASDKLLINNPGVPSWTPIASTTRNDFIIKHLNRMVAANYVNRTISWTTVNDPGAWSSGSAGSADIGEKPMGLKVVDNHLTIPSQTSVYYGFLTGSSTPVYRFERVFSSQDVCYDMHSTAQHGNMIFTRGYSSIYLIEPTSLTDIGGPVWHLIRAYKTSIFKGIVINNWQHSLSARPNTEDPHYVLFPIKQAGSQAAVPVLAFNINKRVWNAFYMGAAVNLDMAYVSRSFANTGVEILGSTTNQISYFDTTGTVARSTSLKSPVMVVDDPTKDYTTNECFIWYVDTGQFSMSLTITCQLGDTTQTYGPTSVSLGTVGASGKVLMERVPVFSITGQGFQLELSDSNISSTTSHCIVKLQLSFGEGGSSARS